MVRPARTSKAASTTALRTVTGQPGFPVWLMAVLLVLVTLALYWPATGYEFINYDDPDFVSSNPHVQGGLSWEALKWSFGLNQGDYWHPLTWLSLMLDASLFGQGPRGFHFTNVALHAANGALLFLLVRGLTGAVWRSVAVAALFALHPLRVESVAWVAERKDVLSGCFGLLALIFYARYAQRAGGSNQWSVFSNQCSGAPATGHRSLGTDHRSLFYLLSLCFFACGLMSKAMLVTWPFVMLLLDYWPLGRLDLSTLNSQRSTALPLLREKIPFFVLTATSCLVTCLTERARQKADEFIEFSAAHRLANAFIAYARYLGKTVWPTRLAVPYFNPNQWSWLEVGRSVAVVVGVCLVVFWLWRRRPYLLVGWCWFLGTLIPVIGLTKGWGSFMADRFTYLPSIGLLLLLIWGVCELTRGWPYRAWGLSLVGGAAIVLCLASTRQQLGYWRDSETLFRHALAATEYNPCAHNNLGAALQQQGRLDEAIGHFQEAIRLRPDSAAGPCNLGLALSKLGREDEAIDQFRQAIRLSPDFAEAHSNLGAALGKKGQSDEAISQLQEAIRLQPNLAEAHNNLGAALGRKNLADEAVRQFQEAIRLKPDYAEAHNNLGAMLFQNGQYDEAVGHFQAALRSKPDYASARQNLDAVLGAKARSLHPAGASPLR